MAIGVKFEIAGGTQEVYDAAVEKLTDGRGLNSLADWPVDGIVSHVSGPTKDGWLVVDIWESEEAFQRFGEKLMPILDEIGLAGLEPEVFPAYNAVTR
jgi:hypothetical protein